MKKVIVVLLVISSLGFIVETPETRGERDNSDRAWQKAVAKSVDLPALRLFLIDHVSKNPVCDGMELNRAIDREAAAAAAKSNLATTLVVPQCRSPSLDRTPCFDSLVSHKLACAISSSTYVFLMALTSVYLAEEALALPPEQREQLAKLLLDSVKPGGSSDDEVSAMLSSRLSDLRSGSDRGVSFEDIFGEKA